MAGDTGVSHTTVSKTFSSPVLPSWGTLELVVETLGGDVRRFHELWLAASTPAGDTGQPPAQVIAGRRDELTAVREHLVSGTGLMLVTGEAGIGKTALLRAATEGVDNLVVVGHCLPLSREVPLLPIADALRSFLTIDDGRWMKEALAECPAYVGTSLSRLLPELDPGGSSRWDDDPWGVEKLFASVASILEALASTRPVALLVEDCHWADRSTLDLLSHMASAPPRVPLVLAWRTADPGVTSVHTEWLSHIRWTLRIPTVELEPLSLHETAQQLRLLWGPHADTSADTVTRVHARSRGLPLYTVQLASVADPDDLPQQLAELLDRRIGDLDGAAWRVARVLGLSQRRVRPSLLHTVSGLDAEDMAEGLRTLSQRRLLRTDTPDAELSHPLFVDAIQRRLLPGEGAQVHARLAEALAKEPGIEPTEVADHWRRAGRPEREIPHRVAAARRARARFAYREALDSWLRVLALQDADIGGGEVEPWDALSQALDAAIETGDIESGRDLARRADQLDLPPLQRAIVLTRVGSFMIDDGKSGEGLSRLDDALHLLEPLQPSPELDTLISERINFFMQSGRFDDASTEVRRSLEVFGPESGPGQVRRGLIPSIWLTGRTGDVEGALALAREGLAGPPSDPCAELCIAVNITGVMLFAAKPAREIEAMAHSTLVRADETNLDLSYAAVILRENVGAAFLHAGDLEAVHRLIDPVTRTRPTLNTAEAHRMLGAVEMREGDIEAAIERCRAADAQIRNRNVNWAEGVPHHAETEIWAGNLDAAELLVREALDVVLPTEAVYLAAPLLCLYARVLADNPHLVQATEQERRATLDLLLELRTRTVTNPFRTHPLHAAIRPLSLLWPAELERIEGNTHVETWTKAATAFDRLTWVHDAAYCRWRAAQAAQRGGEGVLAARLHRRARADAHTHAPLARTIEAAAQTPTSDQGTKR